MIYKIVNAIHNDLLVCFPTETIYALACNAFPNETISKIQVFFFF
ncbi:MAG: Sua5/YciO/YrdC/YwlC family protein [Wolbachia pipientis]|nr:Sua5/YciO/YrdC/YwlC family protein [Wolbachia pipientis]